MITISELLFILIICWLPPLMIWSWARWVTRREPRDEFSKQSLAGLSLATVSALAAILSLVYGRSISWLAMPDPLLLTIDLCGALLSLVGIIFAIKGATRGDPLRRHAPYCAGGVILFWIICFVSRYIKSGF